MQWPVSLQDFEEDSLLTEYYQNPRQFPHEPVHNLSNFVFNSQLGGGLGVQSVTVLRQVLDKEKITRLLICLLISSPALGTLVGILSHLADVGVAVSACIFALACFFQGLAAWFLR